MMGHQILLRVFLSIVAFSSALKAKGFFDCQRFSYDLQDDEAALNEVAKSLTLDNSQFELSCLNVMVENNLFNASNYLMNNYFFQKYSTEEIYNNLKSGVNKVRTKFDTLLSRLQEERNKPVLLRPPFQWAQTLHQIQIEVKYAYRHDVSGCATISNETIRVTEDDIYISAYCQEQENYLMFEVQFPFWAKVNASSAKWEYQPVGKHYISVDKLKRPARWQTLYKEGTAKPPMMKLWFEKHQKYNYQLYDFEEDDIEDYEGHDLIEMPQEQDQNDMAWLFPQKGPGKFKDLADKKKTKKKKGKGKGKKSSKKQQ